MGGGVGGGVRAFSEMVDHVALLRDLFSPSAELPRGAAGLADYQSLETHHI